MNVIRIVIWITFFVNMVNAQVIGEREFSIGEVLEIQSQVLNESRTLNIYLPASYEQDSLKRYPVIYLLDGAREEDFIHVSGLVQFCSFPWINIIEESIVVGIGNVDRKRDFTYPSSAAIDKKEFPSSGQSSSFISFLGTELQTLIDKKYRTSPSKTLIGQSLGGLLATEILFKQPELFDNYIIISPSLWWDKEQLLNFDIKKSLSSRSVYIGVGKEGNIMERLAQSLFLKLSLEKKEELKLFFQYFEQQNHGDALHLAVYDAFEKLFKKDQDH